jgi:hypothetical protein
LQIVRVKSGGLINSFMDQPFVLIKKDCTSAR